MAGKDSVKDRIQIFNNVASKDAANALGENQFANVQTDLWHLSVLIGDGTRLSGEPIPIRMSGFKIAVDTGGSRGLVGRGCLAPRTGGKHANSGSTGAVRTGGGPGTFSFESLAFDAGVDPAVAAFWRRFSKSLALVNRVVRIAHLPALCRHYREPGHSFQLPF